jgi:hypothetical protein
MEQSFNLIYQCPRNNNIGIDSENSIAITIKQDRVINELIVVMGIIDDQIEEVSNSFIYMFQQQLRSVKDKLPSKIYKQHEHKLKDLIDAEKSIEVHKLYTVSSRFYDWELAPNRYGMLSIPSNP